MHKQHAFTIIELLIVIVVVAILAAISVVAYNGIQTRSIDSSLRQGAATMEKALKMWAIDNGNTLNGSFNSTIALNNGRCSDGQGIGFIGRGLYTCTIQEYLESSRLLSPNFMERLPNNTYYASSTTGIYSMMLYQCTPQGAGKYALYWTLRSPTPEDTTALNSSISSCSNPVNIRDVWGMRSARIIQL